MEKTLNILLETEIYELTLSWAGVKKLQTKTLLTRREKRGGWGRTRREK